MMSQIERDAREYWALLHSAPNGWGQHVHPRYGASHYMLLVMCQRHGKEAFDAALDATRVSVLAQA